ncbi:hypothetical protein [Mycobacterium colombiense]|uniref:hypothetical protein n=1 Tax=Mycobacterium colombiense TaxID=339268 RepID=UPI00140316E2|nr:hypothetical protein [Mycobacterium colombiense]
MDGVANGDLDGVTQAVGKVTEGRRHVYEMALKERRRTAGHPAHTASPSDESAKGETR